MLVVIVIVVIVVTWFLDRLVSAFTDGIIIWKTDGFPDSKNKLVKRLNISTTVQIISNLKELII